MQALLNFQEISSSGVESQAGCDAALKKLLSMARYRNGGVTDLLFLEHLPLEELKCFNQCAALDERDNYSHFYRVRI